MPTLAAGSISMRDLPIPRQRSRQPEPDFAPAADAAAENLSIDKAPLPSEPMLGWSWEPIVLMVILAGAVGWWTLAAVRIIRFQHLLKDVRPAPEEWQLNTDELARRIGLAWRPSLCLVPGRVPPMLWAIGGRPRLLVPLDLWTSMGADERTSLLFHELAHSEAARPLGSLARASRGRLVLVAPGRLVGSAAPCARPRNSAATPGLSGQCLDGSRTYATALLAAVEFVSGSPRPPRPWHRPQVVAGMFPA